MEIICVPIIVSITYIVLEIYKKVLARGREKWLAVIPIISLVLGGLLGIALFYIEPSIILAENVWGALIVGLCSGLSATGGNQIFKQLKKIGIEVKGTEAGEEQPEEKAEETAEEKKDDVGE